MIKLSLAVPCFNEQDNAEILYDAVKNVFDGILSYEIIFVNDGSTDNTSRQLKKIYDRHDGNVTVIDFSRNFGKEAAVLAALEHSKGELVCIIDGDMQQRPETVLEMVDYLDRHSECDCVAAYQDRRIESKFISFCKTRFYATINKVTDIYLHPDASDFRTFRRTVADAILSLRENRRFSKGIFSWVGFETYYMPYTAEERHSGKSKFGFSRLMKYALSGIISFSDLPLKLPLYLGGLFSAAGVILLIVFLVLKGNFFELKMILSYILLMTGIILIAAGVMGVYLARIYAEDKRRPAYIEKRCLTYEEKSDE